MRRLLLIMLGMCLGGTLVYCGFNYHVVRTSERVLLVPKVQASLSEVYVDPRQWTPRDWQAHPRVARALLAAGHGELVRASASEGLLREFFHLFEGRSAEGDDDASRQ